VKIKINELEANITPEAFTFEGGRFETLEEAEAMGYHLRRWIRARRREQDQQAEADRLSGLIEGFKDVWDQYLGSMGGGDDEVPDPPPDPEA